MRVRAIRLMVVMSFPDRVMKKRLQALLVTSGLNTLRFLLIGIQLRPLYVWDMARVRQWTVMSLLNWPTKFDCKIRKGFVGPKVAPSFVRRSARSFPLIPTWDGQKAKEMLLSVVER